MKPNTGGPARKPSEPIDETAAMPGPGGVSGWRPAAENISGTPLATPRPTRKSPMSAAAGWPISSSARERDPGEQRAAAQQRDRADAAR